MIGSLAAVVGGAQPPQTGQTGQGNVVRERQSPLHDSAPRPTEKRVSAQDFLKKVQQLADGGNHSVRFEMDKDINVLVVKVFDSKTQELLSQTPAESLLGTAKALQEYRRGLLIDDQS